MVEGGYGQITRGNWINFKNSVWTGNMEIMETQRYPIFSDISRFKIRCW